MRRVLHRTFHFIARARYATWQARRCTLSTPDAQSSMCALRQARAARGVYAPASLRGDVRADSTGGVCVAGSDGAGDPARQMSPIQKLSNVLNGSSVSHGRQTRPCCCLQVHGRSRRNAQAARKNNERAVALSVEMVLPGGRGRARTEFGERAN